MGIWQRVQQLAGKTISTLDRGKEFIVEVVRDQYLVVIPRDHDPRLVLRRVIEKVDTLGWTKDELTLAMLGGHFPGNQNPSYNLAIYHAVN